MNRLTLSLIFLFTIFSSTFAKEGMWIPTLLQKYNIEEMTQMGFKLTAEDIYSVNHASMKDAVVLFGSGCTGEVISDDGLLITNHHCGFSQIQSHSSVAHDYLTDGFWAMNKNEELTNPGLTVQFLVKMEDVTAAVLTNTTSMITPEVRADTIAKNTERVKKRFIGKSGYLADIKPLFNGNQYYLYLYEVFKDVRLVGAPPMSIGKFGGDTDNWIWPRHTGDFSLFRIYAGKDNKPAAYSPQNVPYHPKKHFPINIKGFKEGDFTMVFGNPGSTQRYIPSQAIDLILNQSDPAKIAIRTTKLNIWADEMKTDPGVRIQYSSKYVSNANYWKKWQGEIKGLERLDVLNEKKREEKLFQEWVQADSKRLAKYGTILEEFEKLYAEFKPLQTAYDAYTECIFRGSDIFALALRLENMESRSSNSKSVTNGSPKSKESFSGYFKDYNQKTDEKVWLALLKIFTDRMNLNSLSPELKQSLAKLNSDRFLDKTYRKSILKDSVELTKLIAEFNPKAKARLHKDPIYKLYTLLLDHYTSKVEQQYKRLFYAIDANQRNYTAALLEQHAGSRMLADANLTLRVAYGKIEGFKPADGVSYSYSTTLKGIIEKDNPAIEDYHVPLKLKQLYQAKDFGPYANQTGDVPVAFCASNHTTGGNSGSPVINGKGELIGVNFDRCWEGTMSDLKYDPDQCRNIALDIRYALFVIDKYAGAGYLLKEMEIIK